jgi:hypothetical protein
MISPRNHPNAYATLGSGSVAAFLIFEAHDRLGVDFNMPEQGMIVALVAAAYLFFGRNSGQSGA